MYSKQTILKNLTGLHARPASEFVACAKSFESKVTIRRLDVEGAPEVNAKSIIKILAQGLSILLAGAAKGAAGRLPVLHRRLAVR